jgi:hypothetical protein
VSRSRRVLLSRLAALSLPEDAEIPKMKASSTATGLPDSGQSQTSGSGPGRAAGGRYSVLSAADSSRPIEVCRERLLRGDKIGTRANDAGRQVPK